MNQRVSTGEPGFRWTTISTDGGVSFLPTQKTNLTDQRCHAGLVAMRRDDKRVFVLSSVPGKQRKGLTISLSWDEGETWLPRRVVDVGHTAYSDLAVLPDNTIVCVYEMGESTSRQHLAIARFNPDWVDWSGKP